MSDVELLKKVHAFMKYHREVERIMTPGTKDEYRRLRKEIAVACGEENRVEEEKPDAVRKVSKKKATKKKAKKKVAKKR